MNKKIVLSALLSASLAGALFVSAQTASDTSVDTSAQAQVSAPACVTLQSGNVGFRMSDRQTSGDVTNLQNFLIAKSMLSTSATGFYGANTVNAVKRFQKENGIAQTGVVGPATRAKIKELSCGQTTTREAKRIETAQAKRAETVSNKRTETENEGNERGVRIGEPSPNATGTMSWKRDKDDDYRRFRNASGTPTSPKPPVVTPTPTGSSYTAAQVAAHGTQADCWIIVSGKVYSVSSYIGMHPGGSMAITNVCGKDATTAFNTRGGTGSHSTSAKNTLNGLLIGTLVTSVPTPTPTPTPVAVNGSCGSTSGTTVSSKPSTGLCSVGSATSVSGNGPFTWSCAGSNGGVTASCSANLAAPVAVNGVCGTANGTTVSTKPSTGLCSVGSATSVSGNGPFAWTCTGSNGGATASCSANLTTPVASGYTAAQVATHASASDCWIIVSGKVYSVSSYIPMHPGGQMAITGLCGQDATTGFNTRGGTGSHSSSAKTTLNGLFIGNAI
jgi:cytochrome b involved in lipid metabolism